MEWDPIKVLAAVLLVMRLVSISFMTLVLKRQYKLFRLPLEPEARHVRLVLMLMAAIIWCGQLIPIAIDTATLFVDTKRSNPSTLGISYAVSNASTAIVSSILFWLMYRLIERENVKLVKSHKDNRDLQVENDRLQ
jgi:hypothetical protein